MPDIRNEYHPDWVTPPGEILREMLDERSMSQAELARRTGRPAKTINEIIQAKAALTPETALQLERVLGAPASFWNNLERSYREAQARQEEQERLEAQAEWLDQVPWREMVKLGWLEKATSRSEQMRKLLSFFGIASPGQWESLFELPQASFRHSKAFESDPGALAAWLRRGEIQARDVASAEYDARRFREALDQARQLTCFAPRAFVPRLQEACSEAGVLVVFVPALKEARVSGATRWLEPQTALIQLSLRYKTDDQLWFSFFHEAAHILLHKKRDVFIDSLTKAAMSTEEREADAFAAEHLIPSERLDRLRSAAKNHRLSKAMVQRFASGEGIAPGIVVGRLQHEKVLPFTHLNDLKRKLDWDDGEFLGSAGS